MPVSAQRLTEIADEEIDGFLEKEKYMVDTLYGEGQGFVGDIMLPGNQRLAKYWAVTPDMSDVLRLVDPDWEARIRAGLDTGPANPYWKNLLREPGLLKSTAADFVRLNTAEQKRQEAGGGRVEAVPSPAPQTQGGY